MLAPMASLMSRVQRRDEDLCMLGSDSTTAVITVDKGITSGMKYLRKSKRISIASLTDAVQESGTTMMKVVSEINVHDLFANALPIQRFGMRDFGSPGEPPTVTTELLRLASLKKHSTADGFSACGGFSRCTVPRWEACGIRHAP